MSSSLSDPAADSSMKELNAEAWRARLDEFGSRLRRMTDVLSTGKVGIIVRVSSQKQKLESQGSLEFQAKQKRYFEPYDVPDDAFEYFISVESAHGVDDRPDFERLLRRIRAGHIRIVIAAFADRLSRNWPQFQQLAEALERVKGIIVLEGEAYDLATGKGRHDFRAAANDAVYQSEKRIQRNLVHMCSKARRQALAIPLPAGYCWASLEDPTYVRELDAHDMRDLIGAAPEGHTTNVTRDGRRFLVLPYPDPEIYRSMVLRRDVLLQERDLRAVMALIHEDPQWPHPHHVPARHRGHRFSLADPLFWRDLRTYRASVESEQLRNVVARWYKSPALYGVYAWQLADDVELDEQLQLFGAKVRFTNAWPDPLFAPDQRALVESILRRRDRSLVSVTTDLGGESVVAFRPLSHWRSRGFEALLPEVRCDVIWRHDEHCGAKLVPAAKRESGRLRYVSVQCAGRHVLPPHLPMEAEQLITQTVLAAITPETLQAAVDRIELKESVERQRLLNVTREMKEQEPVLAFLRREIQHAGSTHKRSLKKQLLKSLGEAGERYDRLAQAHADAEAGLATERALSAEDRIRIANLARDLPALWVACADVPGARAALMKVLIQRVYVRRIAARMDYVEIEFPSGERIARIICVAPTPMASAWRQWCLRRIRPQVEGERLLNVSVEDLAEADRIAVELTRHIPRGRAKRAWTGADVRAAAILAMYELAPHPPTHLTTSVARIAEPANGPTTSATENAERGEPLDALVARTGIPHGELEAHVWRGHLSVKTSDHGDVQYVPTERELHRWFPEYARRCIAAKQGWDLDDTWTLNEASRHLGARPRILTLWVRKNRHFVSDASRRPWVRGSQLVTRIPPLLEEAVRNLGLQSVSASDFVSVREAEAILARVKGRPLTRAWHAGGRRTGYALVVRARQPGQLYQWALWAYLPSVIRESADRELVVRWMNGREPTLTAWSPAARKRCWHSGQKLRTAQAADLSRQSGPISTPPVSE